jgi:spoIIIJ-associated protein
MANLQQRVEGFLKDVATAMGLELSIQSRESADGLRIDLNGNDGDLLVRRKGEALDALQHIVNVVFKKELQTGQHVIVDCLGFRRAKDAELRQMALFLGDKAKTSGAPQEIGPLNPYSRRVVHLAIAEDPTLTSESIGDAFMKTVIISAKK